MTNPKPIPKPDDLSRTLQEVYDRVIMEGIVEIRNGDKHIIAKNKFVNQGLIALINLLSCSQLNSASYVPAYGWGGASSSFMVLGNDIATATTFSMTSLVSPIGTAPGTKANSQSISNGSPSSGVYQVTYTATWNAGAVSGILGELGLYLYLRNTLVSAGGALDSVGGYLASRLASADGAFTSFSINTGAPLTIAWSIRFSFA